MINEQITFGLELECIRLSDEASSIMQSWGFTRHYDGSLRADDGRPLPHQIEQGGGSELVTAPMTVRVHGDDEFKNVSFDYGRAKEMIDALCRCAAHVNTSCGIHIHLGNPSKNGKSVWKPEPVRTFLAICGIMEDKIFNLVPPSRQNNRHCSRISTRFSERDLTSYYVTGDVVPRKSDNEKRYCWVNLIETRRKGTDPNPGRQASEATGTIEIRLLGNTRRADYIWAWTQLWVKFAAHVAFLPSSSAILHLVMANALSTEMNQVLNAKKNGQSLESGDLVDQVTGSVPTMPRRVVPPAVGMTTGTTAPRNYTTNDPAPVPRRPRRPVTESVPHDPPARREVPEGQVHAQAANAGVTMRRVPQDQ